MGYDVYDVIVIGAGPAGLSCALYAGRGGLKALVLEKLFVGGQVATTYEVDNYPAVVENLSGVDLAARFLEHAQKFGAEIKYETITALSLDGAVKTVTTTKGQYQSRRIVLAMGAQPRKLGLAREEALRGAGVSYCATCDGAFFRGKPVAVVGGGDTALEDAVYLSRFCDTVHLIHRRNQFRGHQRLAEQAAVTKNIVIHYDTVVEELLGETRVEGVVLRDVNNQTSERLPVDGLFIAVGTIPSTELVNGLLPLTPDGYIETDETMQTSLPGVYAAGDVRKKPLRQIITAAADGAIAGYHITTQEL